MTMSKEMQLLKSKIEFYKGLINFYDTLNITFKINNYDKKIEEYQDELVGIYKRVQELEGENKWLKQNLLY